MKFTNVFLLLSYVLFAECQRETFSQRRQRLINERKRLLSSTTKPPVAMDEVGLPTTPIPRKWFYEEVLKEVDREISNDDQLEFLLKMGIHLKLEKFLPPIPSTLGVVATLLMAAGQTEDFSLDSASPVGGYLFMKHPDSFRRSLLQVSHESFETFLSVHLNMDKIRLATLTIPAYIEEAMKIFATGDKDLMLSDYLPALHVAKESMGNCVMWSSEVATGFEKLANLTDEIHLAASSSLSVKQFQQSELVRNQSINQLMLTPIEDFLDDMRNNLEVDFKRYDQSASDLADAFKSIPTSIGTFYMDVAQVSNGIFGFLPSLYKRQFGTVKTEQIPSNTKQKSSNFGNGSQLSVDPCIFTFRTSIIDVFARSEALHTLYQTLLSIDSSKGRYNCTEDLSVYKTYRDKVQNCSAITYVIDLGVATVKQMENLAHITRLPELAHQELIHDDPRIKLNKWRLDEFARVRKSIEVFYREASQLKMEALIVQETNLPSSDIVPPKSSPWISKQQMANAKYKISLQRESLRVLREAVERNLKTVVNMTEVSIRVLNEIQSWDFEQMTAERAINMLGEGMELISQLKESWKGLVSFFNSVSDVIETDVELKVKDLALRLLTVVGSSNRDSKPLPKLVVKNTLLKSRSAIQATVYVHGMASKFCQISNDYILPRVLKLDAMLKYGNSTDLEVERRLLVQSCYQDEMEIRQLIGQELVALRANIKEREENLNVEHSTTTPEQSPIQMKLGNHFVEENSP